MSIPFNTKALELYLQDLAWDTKGLEVSPLVGGQSNPTYKISCGNQHAVLRKKPTGKLLPSAHAIDREYRVMQALSKTEVPVPKMLSYCEDDSIVGTPFYLMSFLDGRVFNDQSLPHLSQSDRGAIYQEMNRVIAAIHQVDYQVIGLESFGKPGNYFARQVGRWSRQVQDSTIPIPAAITKLM